MRFVRPWLLYIPLRLFWVLRISLKEIYRSCILSINIAFFSRLKSVKHGGGSELTRRFHSDEPCVPCKRGHRGARRGLCYFIETGATKANCKVSFHGQQGDIGPFSLCVYTGQIVETNRKHISQTKRGTVVERRRFRFLGSQSVARQQRAIYSRLRVDWSR